MAAFAASASSAIRGWNTATSTSPADSSTSGATRTSASSMRWAPKLTVTPVGSGTGGTASWYSQIALCGGAAAIQASV